MTTPEPLLALEVQHLYAAQSHAIDSGEAERWADTFTEDGEFHSPSYPRPAVGRTALVEFAREFLRDCVTRRERRRHVITNVAVRRSGPHSAAVTAYLQIIATGAGEHPRLVRITVLDDDLMRTTAGWRIQRRRVTSDSAPGSTATDAMPGTATDAAPGTATAPPET